MSFYKIYKPTEEKVEELRKHIPQKGYFEYINQNKIELEVYVMKDHSQDKISDVIKNIYYYLSILDYEASMNSYQRAVICYEEDEDKTIWYSGWEYSKDFPDTDKNGLYDYVVEELAMLSIVVASPDYFENSEKYSEKLTNISENINHFIDSIEKITDFEIMDSLKEFEVKEEEADELKEDLK